MLWDLWGSGGTGERKRENMHWLKAKDSPIQSRPEEHQLFCILTQRLITRKCVRGDDECRWKLTLTKMITASFSWGVDRGGGGMLLKIFNNWYGGSEMLFDPGGVWMSQKKRKDFEVKYINRVYMSESDYKETRAWGLKWPVNFLYYK